MTSTTAFASQIHLQIASDLFINTFPKDVDRTLFIKPNADILVLLGNVCPLGDSDMKEGSEWSVLREFLLYLSKKFKHVLFVPGNLEFHSHDKETALTVEQVCVLRAFLLLLLRFIV